MYDNAEPLTGTELFWAKICGTLCIVVASALCSCNTASSRKSLGLGLILFFGYDICVSFGVVESPYVVTGAKHLPPIFWFLVSLCVFFKGLNGDGVKSKKNE
mmetsp:Transcript_37981/g.88804  ORF Transcript_37981/g.88804 Transcript_37981/m.88804 type:complete len:102 (-) Transcript_37981:55-360(-)